MPFNQPRATGRRQPCSLPAERTHGECLSPDIASSLGARRGYDIARRLIGVPTVDVVGTLVVLAPFEALIGGIRQARRFHQEESVREA